MGKFFVWRSMFFIVVVALITGAVFIVTNSTLTSGESGQTRDSSDPVTLTNQNITMALNEEGELEAAEKLTTDFPTTPNRRGIFRFFDTNVTADDNLRLGFKNIKTSLDGEKVTVTYFNETDPNGKYLVARLGEENVFVTPGEHIYDINYQVKGATFEPAVGEGNFATVEGEKPDNAESVFYWNVIAPGWTMETETANVSVTFPEEIQYAECSTGTFSSTTGDTKISGCNIEGLGTNTLTITTGELEPYTGVTLRVPLTSVPVSAKTVPWSWKYDPFLGQNVLIVALLVILSVGTAAVGWRWANQTKEQHPGAPLTYKPPQGLSPAQMQYVAEETVNQNKALLSSLLVAANKNLIVIEERGEEIWDITGLAPKEEWDNRVDPVTASVGKMLGVDKENGTFRVGGSEKLTSGKVLKKVQDTYLPGNGKEPGSLSNWAEEGGYFEKSTSEGFHKLLVMLTIPAIVVGIIILALTSFKVPLIILLPLLAFLFGGLPLLSSGAGQRRTTKGRHVWAETEGFERTLTTDSAENRYDFAANKNLFIDYLPYAVMFGSAKEWEKKYRISIGTEPPQPNWYRAGGTGALGYAGFRSITGSKGLVSGFDNALSSSISTYQASQRSSSSGGGGGGGGFGGGGGGGGGGSW